MSARSGGATLGWVVLFATAVAALPAACESPVGGGVPLLSTDASVDDVTTVDAAEPEGVDGAAPSCASACSGCCAGESCLAGTSATACGAGGHACQACEGDRVCAVTGECLPGCGPGGAPCSVGCCLAGTCVDGTSGDACGHGGELCVVCESGCQEGTCCAAQHCDDMKDAGGAVGCAPTDLSCGVIALCGGTCGSATVCMSAASLAVSSDPALATADFNGDGLADLAGVGAVTSVFLGQGGGQLGGALRVGAGCARGAAAAADFDRDGRPDLLDECPHHAVVWLGQGDGTFAPGRDTPSVATPAAVVVADFDGDGVLDRAVAGGTSVSVFLGVGDGAFRTGKSFVAGAALVALAAGDFDGDGRLDLAAADITTSSAVVALGRGDGTFGAPSAVGAGAEPVALATGELDGDGHLDLVVASSASPGALSVLLGAGDGTFSGGPGHTFTVGLTPSSLVLADLDDDGALDVAFADTAAKGVVAVLGHGDGAFEPPVAMSLGSAPAGLVTSDFDGEGGPDLAVAEPSIGRAEILLNGRCEAASSAVLGCSPLSEVVAPRAKPFRPDAVATADFNGDGRPDVAFADPTAVGIVLGAGGGVFGAEARGSCGLAPPLRLATGDFDGDGTLDVAVAMQSSTGIVLGRGNGTFRSCITSPNEVSPDALLAGDFNGDGHLDVAVVQAVGDRPPTFSGSITVLPGRGDGTFGTATTTATGSDVGGGVAGAVAGDFDGDGRLDVALAGPSTSVMLLGDGRGGFAVHVLSFRGAALASGDANGDGALDLAVLDPPRVAILLGRGDGRFSAANELDLATGAYASLAFGDVDGDGHLDLVLGGASAQVLLGAGDGTFAGAVGVGVFPGVTSNLGVADVNGDGRADVVYGGDGRLGVLLGSACTGK